MKRATILTTMLFVLAALMALDLELTPLGYLVNITPNQSVVTYDYDGDGVDEWFLAYETNFDDNDQVNITGRDADFNMIFTRTLTLPRLVDVEDHDPYRFAIYDTGEGARLLLSSVHRFWNNDWAHLYMRTYSFPAMSLLEEHDMVFPTSHLTMPYVSKHYPSLATPYVFTVQGEPHIYQCMRYNIDAVDQLGAVDYQYSYLLHYTLDGDQPVYVDSMGHGGWGVYQSEPNSSVLFTGYLYEDFYSSEYGVEAEAYYSLQTFDGLNTDVVQPRCIFSGTYDQPDYVYFPVDAAIIEPGWACADGQPWIGFMGAVLDGVHPNYQQQLRFFATNTASPYEAWDETISHGFWPKIARFIEVGGQRIALAIAKPVTAQPATIAAFDAEDGHLIGQMEADIDEPLSLFQLGDDFYLVTTDLLNPEVTCYRLDNIVPTDDPDVPVPALELAAWPNPFNPTTTVSFELAQPGQATLEVFNIRGQRVATLVNDALQAGSHEVTWAASGCASGVYFARLTTQEGVRTTKLALLK